VSTWHEYSASLHANSVHVIIFNKDDVELTIHRHLGTGQSTVH
jgi:hypothetical protein